MITVFANPVVNFSVSNTEACAGEAVNFNDLTVSVDVPIIQWIWDFGDGFTSTQQHPIHVYQNPGTYSVVLEVLDANGCNDGNSITNMITIYPSPTVSFTATPSSSCSFPMTVTFQDQSTGSGITGYLWDFGDGTTSNQQNPVHIYNTPGNYTATLTVTGSNGCSGTDSITFLSNGSITADFLVDDTIGCGSVSANFSDQSTSSGTIVSWAWNFGDGGTSTAQNPSHNYTVPGTYDVTLTVTDNNGCSDDIVYPDLITVYARPTADFTADQTQGCILPFTVNFTETSSGEVSYFWEFGDGATSTLQNPLHSYTSSGSYGVRLTVTSADDCTATSFKASHITITIPSADFATAVSGGCADVTVNFSDQSNSASAITNWYWDFDNGSTSSLQNPSQDFTTSGTYNVKLVIENTVGCFDTVLKPISIVLDPGPVADFIISDNTVCISETINFSDASVSGNTIVSWAWDFGDGITSALQNPSHHYSLSGVYNVTLTVIDNSGCTDGVVYGVTVFANPSADFTSNQTPGCSPAFAVNFIETATGEVSWFWDFGDGTVSVSQNPSHDYTVTGSYNVMLVAISAQTCTDTIIKPTTIIADSAPVADFAIIDNAVCISETVNFSDASISDSTIVSWLWDFGDGSTSTLQNPSHSYSTSGSYDVTLMITDNRGCSDDIIYSNIVTVNPTPVAGFTADQAQGCSLPFTVNFTETATDDISWSWDFGDGNSSTVQNPSHDYMATGTYNVMLAVTNAGGCSDTLVQPVNIIANAGPTADFTMNDDDICLPEIINFVDASVAGSAIVSWAWDFGDGNSSSLQNPSHTYTNVGTFTVSLTIETIEGCRDTISKTVETKGSSLVADAGPDRSICAGDSTVLVGSGGWVYSWSPSASLNDSYISSPIAFPANTTTYTVTVFDSLGCAATDEVTVTVHPLPIVSATPAAICIGDSAQLSASGGVSYSWLPASSLSNANISNPFASPDSTTTYTVTVTDANGCVNSVNTTLIVNPLPSITVSASNNFICSGQSTQLNASGGVNYLWTPTNWLDNPNIPNPVSTPVGSITYTVIVTDNNGCESKDSIGITVGAMLSHTVSSDTSICKGDTVSLSASGGAAVNWNPANGLSCTTCNNPDAYPETTTTYYVEIIDTGGCMVNDSVTVTVFSAQTISITNDTFICKGGRVQLNALGGVNYVWSPAVGLDNPNVPFPVASPDTSTTYTVQVISPSGCSGIDSVHVHVFDISADISLSEDSGCLPLDVHFTGLASSDDSIVSWMWDFGNENYSSEQQPIQVFGTAGTHDVNLTVTTNKGCVHSVEKSVVVYPLPAVSAGPDTAICSGGTVHLHGSGGVYYNWSPSVGLNAINIPDPVASPNATLFYELIVTDGNGCVNVDSVLISVNDFPVTTISADVSLCFGDSAQLQVTGGNAYSWTPAVGLNDPNISDPIAKPESTTTYVVHIETGLGCDAVDSVKVELRPKPLIVIKAEDQICLGDSTQFNVSGAESYEWSPSSGLSCNDCSNPVAKPQVSGVYNLLMRDEFNCVWFDTLLLTVNPVPEVHTTDDKTICKGEEVVLTSQHTGATTFEWLPAYGLNSDSILNPIASPQQTTEYVIIARNEFGCDDRDTILINVIDRISASVTDNQRICRGNSVTLDVRIDVSAGNETSVIWLPADAFENPALLTQTVSPDVSTTYSVIASGDQCVSDTQYVHVHVDENPDVDAGENQVTMAGAEVSFTATSNYDITSYRWDPSSEVSCSDCQTCRAFVNDSRTYYVYVTDANGCLGMDSVSVTVIKSCDGDIWLPNSFTPNGDEVNDEFRVRTNGFVNLISFKIFGRWGNLIFETGDINQGWDGKYKGEWVTADVYVWWVRAICSDGQVIDKKGNVTIIR